MVTVGASNEDFQKVMMVGWWKSRRVGEMVIG